MTTLEVEEITQDLDRPEVHLSGPWKSRDDDKILKAWGLELDRKTLDGVAHLHHGGWGHHTFPSLAETMAYAVKASKHNEAVTYLHLLCEASLASQYSLTECALLIRECMALDPIRNLSPRNWANDWALLLITFCNAWESRQNNTATPCDVLGDNHFLEHFIHEQKTILGEAHIKHMERDLEEKIAVFKGGKS